MRYSRAKVQDEDETFLFTTAETTLSPYYIEQPGLTQAKVPAIAEGSVGLDVWSEDGTTITTYPWPKVLWLERKA
jgi:hypothetical protein